MNKSLDWHDGYSNGHAAAVNELRDAQLDDLIVALDQRGIQSAGDLQRYDEQALDLERLRDYLSPDDILEWIVYPDTGEFADDVR